MLNANIDPSLPPRSAWAEVNLDAIRRNTRIFVELVGPETRVMAVVKAGAYGHGAVPVARAALEAGAAMLGVALLQEGVELRAAGIDAPIVVLTPLLESEAAAHVEHRLDATLCTVSGAVRLSAEAVARGTRARAHLKIDTGMGRVGIAPESAVKFVESIRGLADVDWAGLATHFATSDDDVPFALMQLQQFLEADAALRAAGFDAPLRHAANTAAALSLPESRLSCVRIGIGLYGYLPMSASVAAVNLEPALALRARVDFVKRVPAGTSISYGRRYVSPTETTIATIPIGYADGYSRLLTGRAEAIVGGRRCPVVGTICMDQLMVDVGDAPVAIGDVVTLIGADGPEKIDAWDVARSLGTIPYEICTMISARVPRRYA